MARYDITPEGAEALGNLGRDLLKCTNDMLEQDQMLKRKIHSLENDLGIYSDEITEIVDKNANIERRMKEIQAKGNADKKKAQKEADMKTQKEAAAYDTEVRKYCDRAMAKADLFTPMIDHQEMMFQRMISHADHGSNMAFALARMTLRRMKQVYPAQSMRIEVSHNDAEVTMHYRGANPNYVPPKDIF